MGWGDEVIASGQARVAYEADPSRRVAIVDKHGQPRQHPIWTGLPFLAAEGEPCQTVTSGIGARAYGTATDTGGWTFRPGWTVADYVGAIHFTIWERGLSEIGVGKVFLQPCRNPKSTTNRSWGIDAYTAVVDACPDVQFLQATHADAIAIDRPNVTIAPLSFREAAAVLSRCDAYLGGEGGFQHVAAAVSTPAVVIFGGCIDPAVLGYPWHTNFSRGTPCGRYLPCDHCRRAMASISPGEVAEALESLLERTEVVA